MSSRAPKVKFMLEQVPPQRLVEILDITEDGVVTVDSRQKIVFFNRGAAKLFGYTTEEIFGQPLDRLIPEQYVEAHRKQVEDFGRSSDSSRMMGGRRPVTGRRKDGSEFPAEVSISKFSAEGQTLYTAIVRDVSLRSQFEATERELRRLKIERELAQAEAAAKESADQYRRIVETANEGIWELDADGRIVFVNDRMAEMLGYRPDELRGKFQWDFVFDEDRGAVEVMFARQKSGRGEEGDIRFRRRDGQPLWTLMSAQPKFAKSGEFTGALDMFTDITERRRAEENLRETTRQLWQAARLAGVGELAASIAHEINNPLGTVSLRVEQLIDKTAPDDPRRRSLDIVQQEVSRMANLVSNLLQFSRAGRDQVSTVNVPEEISKTIELVSHHLRKRRIHIDSQSTSDVPFIQADRQHLRQVFLNLFTNAADAMSEGGKLSTRVSFSTLRGGPAVAIEISDTGVGIPEELLNRIFEPFFTTKEEGKGTGLGLAICRRIVEQHLGQLEVTSRVGQGTTIRVVLPVHQRTNVAELRGGR